MKKEDTDLNLKFKADAIRNHRGSNTVLTSLVFHEVDLSYMPLAVCTRLLLWRIYFGILF